MASRRLTDIFLQLARIDALPGKEAAMAAHAAAFLKNLGLPAQLDGTAAAALSNTSNVVCQVGGGGDFALLAHMDTVRPTSSSGPEVTADRITSGGRGPLGADGRAGMAAILYAVERAVNTNAPLKPFTLAFTTRGAGSMAGARHLALPAGVRSGFTFATGLPPGAYTASSHGIAVFSADILGKAADAGANPEGGICAISIAARAIAALSFGRHDPETTSNVGTIAGGAGTSIVPPAALVRGQVRAADAAKALPILDAMKAQFDKAASAAGGAAAFKWSWEFQPFRHAPEARVRVLAEAALRGAGLVPGPAAALSGGEAHALNARGIAAVAFGVGGGADKPNDEYILLDHLAKAAETVSSLIKA